MDSPVRITYVTFGDPPIWDDHPDITITADPPSIPIPGSVVVLQTGQNREKQAALFLEQVRKTRQPVGQAVFFSQAPSPILNALGDGKIDKPEDALARARRMADRETQLAKGLMDLGADFRLVGHLHVHESPLMPVQDPDSPVFYRYPLAEVLRDENSDVFSWLDRLSEMQLIEATELVDRLRLCPQCRNARLNYLDVCSACGNLNISKSSFLHCFTCGHVAEEDTFLKEGRLICPNCQTRLRQIGSDYDRALESYLCHNCGSRQADPRVVARCISCGKSSDQEQLTVHEIHAYRLSTKGESTALLGNADFLLTSLDILNFTRHDVFIGIIDWMLLLHRRYEDLAFGLIGLRLPNLTELVTKLGLAQTLSVMDTFAAKLRELVRDTDLISRSDRSTLWLAQPKTGSEGSALVHSRIQKMQDEMTLADKSKLMFATVSWVADTGPAAESAEMLLATLTSTLDDEAGDPDRLKTPLRH